MKPCANIACATLSPGRIRLNETVRSKKKALELCADAFSQSCPELDQDSLLDAFMLREKLGSTALENGIALPHCRIPGCEKAMATIISLTESIDFDARDQLPVDLLWALIVPEQATEQHLQILAAIAEFLSDPASVAAIRNAADSDRLYTMLTSSESAL